MVADADADRDLVDTMLDAVVNTDLLSQLGTNVEKMALRDAAEHIVDEVERIISQSKS